MPLRFIKSKPVKSCRPWRIAAPQWRTVCPVLAASTALLTLLCVGWVRPSAHADQPAAAADAAADADADADGGASVLTMLRQYCVDCHGPETQEAGIDLEVLTAPFGDPRQHQLWLDVLTVVRSGQMPPEAAEQPPESQRRRVIDQLTQRWQAAAAEVRGARDWRRLRRLTVEQYEHTLQSLFDVEARFADLLPPDPVSADGYRTNTQLLSISSLQMDYFLEIARAAVSRYVAFDQRQPPTLRYHIELEDLFYTVADRNRTLQLAPRPLSEDAFAWQQAQGPQTPPQYATPLPPLPPGRLPMSERLRRSQPKLNQQYLPVRQWVPVGDLIVRVRAAATRASDDGAVPRMRVDCGVAYGDGDMVDALTMGEVDVAADVDRPEVYTFRARIEDAPLPADPDAAETIFETLQLFISNVSRDEAAIYDLGPGSFDDPDSPAVRQQPKKREQAQRSVELVDRQIQQMRQAGTNLLHLDAVQIEIVPSRGASPAPRWLVRREDGQSHRSAARELLTRFMPQAYRRPVSAAEVDAKLVLFDQLSSDHGFEHSLRETLVAVLVSPHFLMLETIPPESAAVPGELQADGPDAHVLASRLSYLLWSTMPDQPLLQLAASGELSQPAVYAGEVQRMLDDPRCDRFRHDFCQQWLRLDRFPLIAVSADRYPAYDDDLAALTVQETRQWFADVMRGGGSAKELIDADHALLNQRLAEHYGLPPLVGGTLRRTALPQHSVRGGLLTQAAVLTMNSDGADSHPIRRGVWILDRLLNDPPPPPPPNVPLLEAVDEQSDTLSLKQRLQQHRQQASCTGCHEKIDPWGIALEGFDATGRQRASRDARHSTMAETLGELPDGTQIDGVQSLKHYLLEDRFEQFTEALVHHMLVYALGRRLDLSDQWDARQIHQRWAASDYRLQELVVAIAHSNAFRH